jgi:integrase
MPAIGKLNRNTRSYERSAYRFWAASEILEHHATKPEYAVSLYQIIKKVDAKALGTQMLAETLMRQVANDDTYRSITQERESKRKSLTGLKNDWRQKLLAAAAGSKYASQIQVMIVCGCRPAEMEKGIQVERLDGICRITIEGAKVSENMGSGQIWRTIDIQDNHPLLIGLASDKYQASARAIENAVEHFASKLWPSRKEKVSAYTLRHAAATDFKCSGLSKVEIAAALGHQSTATMSFYGTANKRNGGLMLVSVTAATVVRVAKVKSKFVKSIKQITNTSI